jgi:hypothetical protein
VAEPTPAERSVRGRELEGRGIPSRTGNPGTYLGEVEVDGRRYAKFSAEPGTWVSSSMKTMGYDRVYPTKDGYGAYRGLVLDPNGKPLADPDRIRPGDQYLVPERTAQVAPVRATDTAPPVPPAAPAAPARTEPAAERRRARPADAAPATPKRLNLRPAPEAAPSPAGARRQRIPDDLELEPKERDELERLLNDPSSEALIAEELRQLALDGIDEAMAGRADQEEFGGADNAAYAFVNDWVSNRQVPYIGAWHNTAMLFRRMLEQVQSGDLDDALLTGRTGYSSLADTQAAWNEYTQANLRLGELVIGTAEEIRRTGVVGNLRATGLGLAGGVYGAGKRLSEFVAGVIGLLVDPGLATHQFLQSLVKVVDAAFQLGRAYGKDPAEFMPKVIDALSRQSRESLERLSKLPADRQAWAVGEVFGEIEGDLIPIAAASSIGGSLRAGAPAATGFEGARLLEGMRGLAVAEGRMVVAGGAAAATLAVADSVQLAGFLSAFALAAGTAGGGPKGKVVEGEVTTMDDFKKRGQSTELRPHEVVPHSLLEDVKLAIRRGVGAASRNNPVIALSPKVHAIVGRYQWYFEVMYRSQRAGMTVRKIISLNIKALRGAGVPESVVRAISRQVLRHALNLKII